MAAQDWAQPSLTAVAYRLDGDTLDNLPDVPSAGGDDSFLVAMNGETSPTDFTMPAASLGEAWHVVFDGGEPPRTGLRVAAGETLSVAAGGIVVLIEANR